MALRVLELKKKLDEYRAKIAAGEEKLSGFSIRSAELDEKIENAETEEKALRQKLMHSIPKKLILKKKLKNFAIWSMKRKLNLMKLNQNSRPQTKEQ